MKTIENSEEKYKSAQRTVRKLRQQIMANFDEKDNVIDQALDEKLGAQLETAKKLLIKLTPKSPCSRSEMYLRAYA